jgi:hypothetical protein
MTPAPQAARPPWTIITVVAVLGVLSLLMLGLAVVAMFGGTDGLPWALMLLLVFGVFAATALGLWQRRRGARIIGLVIGVAFILAGLGAVGQSRGSGLPYVLAGALVVGALLHRSSRAWTTPAG